MSSRPTIWRYFNLLVAKVSNTLQDTPTGPGPRWPPQLHRKYFIWVEHKMSINCPWLWHIMTHTFQRYSENTTIHPTEYSFATENSILTTEYKWKQCCSLHGWQKSKEWNKTGETDYFLLSSWNVVEIKEGSSQTRVRVKVAQTPEKAHPSKVMSARTKKIDVWKSNLSVARTVGPNIFRLFQFNKTKTLTLSLNFCQVQREDSE